MDEGVAVITSQNLIRNLLYLPLKIKRNLPIVLLGNDPYGDTCAIQNDSRLASSTVARMEHMMERVVRYDSSRVLVRLLDEYASFDPKDFDKNTKYFFCKAARDVMFALFQCYPDHYWDNYPITPAQLEETWGNDMINCIYLDTRYHEAEREDRVRRGKRIARALTATFKINSIWMKFDVSFAHFGKWSSEFGRTPIRPSIYKSTTTDPISAKDKATQTGDNFVVEDATQTDEHLTAEDATQTNVMQF